MSAALYIHIPYCLKKCAYCDFFSKKFLPEYSDIYLAAVMQEMALNQNHPVFSATPVSTIYFGGGTPSVLPARAIEAMLARIHESFPTLQSGEITLEVNPETVDLNYLQSLRSMGVNRLSIGVQSFSDIELKLLGRIHDSDRAQQAIGRARQAGFENLSLDLIFALPGQSLSSWQANLDRAVTFSPEHLSIYCLTVEPGTALHRRIHSGKLHKASEEMERAMYLTSIERLSAQGYRQYEISNFARPGQECRHNKKYWDGSPYLGLGPSAHSFWQATRQWNVADVPKYFALIEQGVRPVDGAEILTREQQQFECIMLSLRTTDGVDLPEFKRRFGIEFESAYKTTIETLRADAPTPLFRLDPQHFSLTPEGLVLYDEICSRFVTP
ncbi:MAG: radical SAM family heme chaperone HemW [Candidatus Zhuqueibacterota bacterium]